MIHTYKQDKMNENGFITCDLKGPNNSVQCMGLGNQLFCAATTIGTALDKGMVPVFRFNEYQDPYRNNIFRKLNVNNNIIVENNYKEPHFHYAEIPSQKNMCISGYFQSEKYFQKHRELILDIFDLTEIDHNFINLNFGDIFKNNKTVSIHVRIGDYLLFPNEHPICELDYFKRAMECFDDDVTYLIFSDNIEWAKENFKQDNFIYVTKNDCWTDNTYSFDISKGGYPDYIEMYLMSMCDHNIIANSSFSWWGAWLNKNPNKKVIAPEKWFGPTYSYHNLNDLIPNNWKKL